MIRKVVVFSVVLLFISSSTDKVRSRRIEREPHATVTQRQNYHWLQTTTFYGRPPTYHLILPKAMWHQYTFEQAGLFQKPPRTISGHKCQSSFPGPHGAGEHSSPRLPAQQYANMTIRVDVPMLGGVATFSNIQNVYLTI